MKWLERIDPEKALKLGQVIMRVTPWFLGVFGVFQIALLSYFLSSSELHRFVEIGSRSQWAFWLCLGVHILFSTLTICGAVYGLLKKDRPLAGLFAFGWILIAANFTKILGNEKRLAEEPSRFLMMTTMLFIFAWMFRHSFSVRHLLWSTVEPAGDEPS